MRKFLFIVLLSLLAHIAVFADMSFAFSAKNDTIISNKYWQKTFSDYTLSPYIAFNNNTAYGGGLAIGSKASPAGTFSITSTVAFTQVTEVELKINTGGTAQVTEISIGDEILSPTEVAVEKNGATCPSYTFKTSAPVDGIIKIIINAETRQFYLNTITVKCYDEFGTDPVSKIESYTDSITLTIGHKAVLGARVYPATAATKTFSWSTENPTIATISNDVVKAVGIGETNVIVTSTDGIHSDKCHITVVDKAPGDPFILVTSNNDLFDGDKIIFSSADSAVIMDTYVSGKNISALKAEYSQMRDTVWSEEGSIYTLKALDNNKFAFIDVANRYLYADGRDNTPLDNTLENHLKAKPSLDYQGKWKINIDEEKFTTTVQCDGNSDYGMLLYSKDANLFSCYQKVNKQVLPIEIYRLEVPMIKARNLSFGKYFLKNGSASDTAAIEIIGTKLNENITFSFKYGSVFSTIQSALGKNGGILDVVFNATVADTIIDTLTLTSGDISRKIQVKVYVHEELKEQTVAEINALEDGVDCKLNPVTVIYHNDAYLYVEDETGYILVYDPEHNAGVGYSNGMVLTGMEGVRTSNYKNPEFIPSNMPIQTEGEIVVPDTFKTMPTISDASRYIYIHAIAPIKYTVNKTVYDATIINGDTLVIYDKFGLKYTLNAKKKYNIEGFVTIYNKMIEIFPIKVQQYIETGVKQTTFKDVEYINNIVYNPNNLELYIFNVNGSLMDSGYGDFDLTNYASGVYIVTDGKHSTKIIR